MAHKKNKKVSPKLLTLNDEIKRGKKLNDASKRVLAPPKNRSVTDELKIVFAGRRVSNSSKGSSTPHSGFSSGKSSAKSSKSSSRKSSYKDASMGSSRKSSDASMKSRSSSGKTTPIDISRQLEYYADASTGDHKPKESRKGKRKAGGPPGGKVIKKRTNATPSERKKKKIPSHGITEEQKILEEERRKRILEKRNQKRKEQRSKRREKVSNHNGQGSSGSKPGFKLPTPYATAPQSIVPTVYNTAPQSQSEMVLGNAGGVVRPSDLHAALSNLRNEIQSPEVMDVDEPLLVMDKPIRSKPNLRIDTNVGPKMLESEARRYSGGTDPYAPMKSSNSAMEVDSEPSLAKSTVTRGSASSVLPLNRSGSETGSLSSGAQGRILEQLVPHIHGYGLNTSSGSNTAVSNPFSDSHGISRTDNTEPQTEFHPMTNTLVPPNPPQPPPPYQRRMVNGKKPWREVKQKGFKHENGKFSFQGRTESNITRLTPYGVVPDHDKYHRKRKKSRKGKCLKYVCVKK